MQKLLLSKEEFLSGVNFSRGLSEASIRVMMNANAQYLYELLRELHKDQAFSQRILALAIHLNHYFFHKNEYINFDKALVACACLLLAHKMFDRPGSCKVNALHTSYRILKIKLEPDAAIRMPSEKENDEFREKVVILESTLCKSIGYQFEFEDPFEFLDEYFRKYFRESASEAKVIAYVMLMDMHRAGLSLFHTSRNLSLAALFFGLEMSGKEFAVPSLKKGAPGPKKKQKMEVEPGEITGMSIEESSSHQETPFRQQETPTNGNGQGMEVEPSKEEEERKEDQKHEEFVIWIKATFPPCDFGEIIGTFL